MEAPPGISVDLPYESGLVISGRKLIALKMAQTRRKSAKRAEDMGVPQNQNEMEMRQELQVRIKGKVGRKVTVNVDFDDTKDDKRDISVMYQGDPGEFVQEAAFGDITLSLPATEFVSFSKQLFGVRTKLQYKNASLMAIGSRTKGTTETKRFNGATKFERRVIAGHNYIKDQYYSVAFTTRPIELSSLVVWQYEGANFVANTTFMTAVDFDSMSSTATLEGYFRQLKSGDDYSLDSVRGILFMKRMQPSQTAIAVNYQFTDDLSWLNTLAPGGFPALVKTPNDTAVSFSDTATAHRREIKTFYSFGNIRIVEDNGNGNFLLRTIDSNQEQKIITLDPTGEDLVYLYRSSTTLTEERTTLEVDFVQGRFNVLFSTGRFDPDHYLRVDSDTLYNPTPTSDFSFLTEYRYRLRDFQLRPNIVFGSERVTVNGRMMRSEIDYFLDPISGLLQFFNETELDENSQIEVTYDYAPFGGQLGQTLVGTRLELAVVPGRFQLGSTFLYTFAPKTTVVPDVRSTPASLMVLEADGRLTDVRVPLTNLKMSLSGEAAQSREDPNLYGKALVDSMEGVAKEDPMVMDADFWPLGANPGETPLDPLAVSVTEFDMALQDIVGTNANVEENEKVRVMEVSLNADRFGAGSRVSLLQSLPNGANRDFSEKTYLEMWVDASDFDVNKVDMRVYAGVLNEDADRDWNKEWHDPDFTDGAVTEDTEDLNVDLTLNAGEDVGYPFHSSTGEVLLRTGADNGRIDRENANGGVFHTSDFKGLSSIAELSDLSSASVLDRNGNAATLNDEGWLFIRVPLNLNSPDYLAVEHVRVTFEGLSDLVGTPPKIRIAKLAFVGNTWEKPVVAGDGVLTVGAVNNLDNPDYESLIGNSAYKDLYGESADNRSREQALLLEYTLPTGSTVTTRSVYGTPRDFSHHKTLNFFFQRRPGVGVGETLVVQFGSETDYFQYTRPINSHVEGWVLESLRLADRNNDGTPETVESDVVGSSVTVVGSPNLARIGQFKFGLINPTGAQIQGVLWVNEIHVSGSRTRVGDARRFSLDGQWDRWGSFGGAFRRVDRNFQTLTSPVVNQDREEVSGYGSFSRFKVMPLSGKISRSKTTTPAVLQTGQSQLVSVLSEGREETVGARGDGQFLLSTYSPSLPAFSYSGERSIAESTTNQDRRDRTLYSGSMDYTVPGRLDIVPGKKFTFRPLPDTVFVKYTRGLFTLSYFPERKEEQLAISTDPVSQRNAVFANTQVDEQSDEWTGRMGFSPWDGLVFTPNYSQRRVGEQRDFSEAELAANPGFSSAVAYDKSFSQTRGLAGSWRIFSWLEPRITWSQTGTETNGLPTASSPTAVYEKTLDRTASGDLFLSLAPRDLFPKLKLFKSLNMDGSFRVESSDNYSGVPADFSDWRKPELFKVSNVDRRDGSTMFGLLSPLEFENSSARRTQQTARNTLRYTLNWSPLDWLKMPYRVEPFKTLNLNNTLTVTNEHTETTQTARDVVTQSWPDMIMTLRDSEKMLFLERWLTGSQANIRYSLKKSETFLEDRSRTETKGLDYRFSLFTKYDVFYSLALTGGENLDVRTGLLKSTVDNSNQSLQVGTKMGSWRLTPSGSMRSDVSQDSTGRYLQDLQVQSVSILGRFDKSYPRGFRFPFTKRVFTNVNRLTLDAKLAFDRRISSLNYERDNTDTYTGEATGEWEISKNFRLSFGGKLGLVNNRARPEDGLMTVELNSQLVIQF
ncbi:MAG: hypothetical protein KBG07_02960 [Elusimicrobia bacterium]|nr:hypothetical protein [Elusimicrobiota bacterium]